MLSWLTMRVARTDGGFVHFYTFSGEEWRESAITYTQSDRATYMSFVGGNAVLTRSISRCLRVREWGTDVCTAMDFNESLSMSYYFYMDGQIGMLSSTYVNTGTLLSCGYSGYSGSPVKVEKKGILSNNAPYARDGRVYASAVYDAELNTEIPLSLVNVCNIGICRNAGMRDGILYGILDRLLWYRDIRAPTPCSMDVRWPAGYFHNGMESTVVNPGLLMSRSVFSNRMHIVDLRYSTSYYMIDLPIVENRYTFVPLPD